MRIRVPGSTKESRALERLARESIGDLRASFMRAIRATQENTVLAQVERAIAVGDFAGAVRAVPLDAQMATKLSGAFLREFRGVFEAAGAVSVRTLPTKTIAEFSVVDPRAMEFVRDYGARRVAEITAEQRLILQRSMSSAMGQGFTPRETAKLIRGEIGLHRQWAQAVDNRRKKLLEMGLSKEAVVERALRYEKQLLDARSMNIARTEIQDGITAGEIQGWRQAVDQGVLGEDSTKVWDANPGTDHDECLQMDGQEVGIFEKFVTPKGELIDGPTLHTACVCGMHVRPGGEVNPLLAGRAA